MTPVEPEKPQPPDPLEEALAYAEGKGMEFFPTAIAVGALAAIRVLKRGHERGRCQCAVTAADATEATSTKIRAGKECWEVGHVSVECGCGAPLPCPVLAEAAEALRGGK